DWGDDPRAQGPRFRILGLPDNGTFAEFVKVPAANVFPRPPHLSIDEAAALPLAGLTAYRALVTRGQVRRGEAVVARGIGGGGAACALLIGRHFGARVLGTSGWGGKRARARGRGAGGGWQLADAGRGKGIRGA